MKIDITPALKDSDVVIPFDYYADLSEMMLSFGEKAIKEPVHLSGEISGRFNATWLKMNAGGNFLFACDRCGKEFAESFSYDLSAMLTTDVAEVDSEELIVAEGSFLNVDSVAETLISLSAPSKHLCNTTCKGLCARCGKNLDTEECDCDKKKIDPRLAKLAEFFNDEN